MKKVLIICGLVLAATLGLGCGDDESCKDACTKLSSCGLKSSGLSCDDGCDQGECAACIEDRSCSEISGGQCASDCPGVSFTKK